MKIILSRKGFDSQYGGVASPIFPDGSMVSLPIPSGAPDPARFGDIAFGDTNLGEVAAALTGRPIYRFAHAHHDPDLCAAARPRLSGWRPAFGQVGAAQKHLQNQGVGPGDLFLFFGWFREVEPDGAGGWRYRRGTPDLHVLFGWLQVGEALRLGPSSGGLRASRPELGEHPHFHGRWDDSNTVYVASDKLVIGGEEMGAPGGGTFPRFHPGLQLTKPGCTRTVWSLPGWFLSEESGPTLSYHTNPARWERDEERVTLRSVAKGQEFVLRFALDSSISTWLSMLLKHAVHLPAQTLRGNG